MTEKENKKHERELTELKSCLNSLDSGDWNVRYKELRNIHSKMKSLASTVGASLILGADILNTTNIDQSTIQNRCVVLEAFIGELINNIRYALQTKIMLNACVFAKWSCFWAAIAATLCFLSALAAWIIVYLTIKGG